MAKQLDNHNPNLVLGRVLDRQNHPLANLIVQAYDRDMRSEELLGDSTTDREGKYEITWSHSQLSGRGKKEADLVIKVFTRKKKTLLYESDMDAVRFNASPREEINITIKTAITPEKVEYDHILKEVSFLADTIAIGDLEENDQHRDISFLSKEVEIPAQKIEYLVVAHRLQAESKIDATFFYALLRKNTLLKNDFVTSLHARLVININTEIVPLLYDAALTDPNIIQRDVEAAVKDMIVSVKAAKECQQNVEQLQHYKNEAEEYYTNEHPRKILNIISRFVLEDKISEMGTLFRENKNDLNAFLKKVTDDSFFTSDTAATEAKASIALGEILGFDATIISQIKESQKIEKPEDVKKLAALNTAGWKKVLRKSAATIHLAGKPIDKKLVDLHASSLVRKMEKDYPTLAFSAQLAREKRVMFKNQEALKEFFAKHDDFDLQHSNIDLFLNTKEPSPKNNDAMREELKAVQRVFKLIPHYRKTNALREQHIHSAQSIAAIGKTRFVNEIAPKTGMTPKEAQEIFAKAERRNAAAMLLAGELQDTIRAKDVSALGMQAVSEKLEAVSKDFPNLKSLFKLSDVCACEHCRSVYSPAAYLVEILQFLDKRSVVDLTIPPPPPPEVRPTSHAAKDVLFERRPDLGDIDLSCENANIPVPYIDLACELLEEAVSPVAGIAYTGVLSDGPDPLTGTISNGLLAALQGADLPILVSDKAQIYRTEEATNAPETPPYEPHYLRDKQVVCKIIHTGANEYEIIRLRQTLSSAEELAAAPEYVNRKAYKELKKSYYAFTLPFDLDHTEANAYFSRFGVPRAKLMQDFQSEGDPADEAIAAEALGLTDAERTVIVTPKPHLSAQQLCWNAPPEWDEDPAVSGNVVEYMKRIDHFLDKTGLTYKELELLLALQFIDPDKKLFIKHHYDDPSAEHPTISCDTAKKEIAELDEDALDRIHRFLRLQKKTGWKFEILDEIISQANLGNTSLDDACVIKAADLQKLSEETGIKLEELIGFYGKIPYKILKNDAPKPLYHQVFLNKAKNGFIDEGLLPEHVDGSQLLSHVQTSISLCLQIQEQDLETFLLPLLPDGNLTLSNLSFLFAASRLMSNLKLKADDFSILIQLTGIPIQDSPRATLDFVEAVNVTQKSPLQAADLQFMLCHEATNLDERKINNDRISSILEKLQKDYQSNLAANRSPFNDNLSADEQKETLQTALSTLSGIEEEDVRTFIKFIDRDWTSAHAAKTFTDDTLNALFDTASVKTGIDALQAAPDSDISNEQKDLLKAFLDSIAAYQLHLGKLSILEETLATMCKAGSELVTIVLKYAKLKQPAPGTSLLSDILLSDDLIDTNLEHDPPQLPAIHDTAFPDQYRAIRLLHKLFPLIKAFNLEKQELEWCFENIDSSDPNKLDWFEWDSIPYGQRQTAIDYSKYAAFAELINLSKQLTPVPNPFDVENPITFFTLAEMLLPAGSTTRLQFLEAFSLLAGYNKEDTDAIDAHVFPVFNLSHYRDAKTWKLIIDCAEDLRKLGSIVARVAQYIKPVLTDADTRLLRAALKARYDENTWLSTLKEIMDAIRPQKRDALVAYLRAVNPDMKDENDLYDYFLVDVEMEACMPSSRIVQAHGVIQLFVQRCLMGLEPKAAADLNNDKSWDQWKWMKNYRVWEANRKVFLYPENWIEAELRDDKSFLFTELENELQQNELTEFTAEQALITYLEKLDNIAFLEVMAAWYQANMKTMHVFARTKGGDPEMYYYRRFEQEQYWTPWEKVELDITGNHLLAFVRNNRLCLVWPVFSEEPDPNQKSRVPDTSDQGEEIAIDKTKRKLKIQLAISEFANKKWQPKKISKDAVKTPPDPDPDHPLYTDQKFVRENITFFYNEFGQQIVVFDKIYTGLNGSYNEQLVGAFDLTGCKGYPELAQAKPFTLHFIPKFQDTNLFDQRYKELDLDYNPDVPEEEVDDLSVLNVHTILMNKSSDLILRQTPGTFRLTYPHQLTMNDLLAFLFQSLLLYAYSHRNPSRRHSEHSLRIPLGSLLPYFMEDSTHAYVIIPGFYTTDKDTESGDTVSVSRTGSHVLQLIEDIIALSQKYIAAYRADPEQDIEALVSELIRDPEFQDIQDELKMYPGLDPFYAFLEELNQNEELDDVLEELKSPHGLLYGEQFKNMYHPLICPLRTTLYKGGIPELMKRETQLQQKMFDFQDHYSPNEIFVPKTYTIVKDGVKKLSYPVEDIDFATDGSYSGYNWELFFHVPFLIATRLTQNQRFEEAMTWFHYIFNPTGALEGSAPQKYWVTKPFYLTHANDYINQRIDSLLYKTADPATPEIKELEFAVEQWRKKPFKPHVIARFRPVAYQKAVLMKYIDNLIEWGDYLFHQDTMESIVQATQMYILGDKLLGPKPRIIPPAMKAPHETYNQLEAKIQAFGNALIDLENILPDLSALPEGGAELPAPPITLSMLYFCIPQNDKMLEYWDRIADRLFKIRHCQNIDGVERTLALFAPPIDPGMLVRAAAAGLDLSSILTGINAPTPYYRFNVLSQKATELAQEVRGLGASLLQTLEKKDAEAISLLRSELEMQVLNALKDMKLLQIQEAKEQIEILKRTKVVTKERDKYYSNIKKIILKEQLNLDKLSESQEYQVASQIVRTVAGALRLIPEMHIGANGFGGSPEVVFQFGGSALSTATNIGADILNILSSIASYEANRASILGGYERRYDDWKLQERLAKKELAQIDKQIVAAEIRKEIAETDLKNHELQIENAGKIDEFMRSKFTNKELYGWMIGQISSVYFRAYQLAHDFAKKAERSYRFELGNDDSFIQYGYWDSLKKGLQSADHLIHDIKRMETSYLDKNKREYELTKHVSLAMLDPLALVKLRTTGICDFEIPEALYDMDHAGQYFRRIKSVSISLPCIAGPYTSVSAKLSLVSNKYRKNSNPDNVATTGYTEDLDNDERFVYNVGSIQSIAASNSQNDSGVFELNFRDERYLPFEGTGAISSWRLELPEEVRQFDYNTISDLIVHVKYTAREGGSSLKRIAVTSLKDRLDAIRQELSQTGLHTAINMKHDRPNEWQLLKKNGTVGITIDKFGLPYMAQTLAASVENVIFIAKITDDPPTFTISVDGTLTELAKIDDEWQLCQGENEDIDLDGSFELSVDHAQLNNLEDLMLVVKFRF